jgi:hypothetical protein
MKDMVLSKQELRPFMEPNPVPNAAHSVDGSNAYSYRRPEIKKGITFGTEVQGTLSDIESTSKTFLVRR